MKKLVVLAMIVSLIFGVRVLAFAADTCKIAIVDMERFQQESVSFQKVRVKLMKKFDALQKKLDQEKQELIKLEEELRKQSMMLSLDAKEDKRKELNKKRRHYKYLYDEFTQEMKDAEMEAKRAVGREIEKVVNKIGKERGYTLILDKRTLGLIYYDHAIDITDEVIKAYDTLGKKK